MVVFRKNCPFLIPFLFSLIFFSYSFADDSSIFQSKRPLLQSEKTRHNLGTIKKGTEFGYAFPFSNRGEADLKLLKATAKSPGEIYVRMPSIIPSGEERYIYISQDSNEIRGEHTLEILIQTNDPDQPEVLLTLSGYVQWPVEILPRALALMRVEKGQSIKKEFTLSNHTQTPLEIKKIEFDKKLFRVEVRESEKGKRFELTVLSQRDAPLGEHRESINFHTNLPDASVVSMAAWLKVHDRIYTNLQEIDFGERPLREIYDPNIRELTNEILIINGMSTPGFKVLRVECNIDFLAADLHPIAKNGVHRVDVYFKPENARKEEFQGSLIVYTNDDEFRNIVLPVRGKLY